MKRNRILVFLSALGVLVGLGVVVVLMFQDSSTPPGPATVGPARTDAPAPVNPVETPKGPIVGKPAEAATIKPKSVTEPQVNAQDAGLGGVVQNEQGMRIADATCDLFEDTAAIKDRTQEGELREKQVTNSEGYFLFDRFSLALGERYVLKVAHKDYMTERKAVDLKKDGNVIYVTLKTGTAINGTVRTAAGQPIAGATVTVYDMNQGALDPNGSVETFVMADVTGQYNVAHVCPGMKKIQASAAGYATADRQAVQVEQAKPLSGMDFALNEGGGISGQVAASDGTPVGGAFVVARPIRLGPKELPNQPPSDAREIQSRREADARGRDTARGDTARGGVQSSDGGMQEKEAAEGEELARQQGRDEATAKLANLKQAQISEAAAAQIKAEKMEREAAAMKGAPAVPGKKFAAPQQPGAMTTLSVRTNPDGTFNVPGTEVGTYQVSVTGTGFIPAPQQTVESPSGGLQFMLQPNARIVGRVIDDETKNPVLAFTLGITNSPDEVLIPVHTKKPFGPPRSKDGNFEYVDVKPGRYWLVADAPGYAGGRSQELVIQQGERREGVVINLVRGATIKGRVLDAKGGPVANATVQPDPASLTSNGAASIFLSVMMQNMRRDIREAKTDAQGNYSIPNMLSGSYTLTVRHPEYGPQTTASFVVPNSGDISQPDVLMSRGATIKGRVKLPDGSPDPKAMVQIAPVGGTPNFSGHRSAYTDADGRFEVNGLALGQYRVVVAQRNGQPDLGTLFTTLKNPNLLTLSEGEVKEVDL